MSFSGAGQVLFQAGDICQEAGVAALFGGRTGLGQVAARFFCRQEGGQPDADAHGQVRGVEFVGSGERLAQQLPRMLLLAAALRS